MISLKELSKEKLVGYFLILWGISYLMNAVTSIVYYGSMLIPFSGAMAFQVVHSIIFIIVHSALGSILVLLGCKFVK
ncbi:TPA: hypothetical protein HA231_01295 [Candidatus Woesearchaeota archaeon]|nr:hypothetical protein [Candidatus Woesearchaeota archaeon]